MSPANLFPNKILFGNNKKLQFWTLQFNGKPCTSSENKEEEGSFIEERVNSEVLLETKSSLEETGYAKCTGFSLAEL